jgi:hypothetical protein
MLEVQVQEVKLEEEQVCGLHSFDGWHLSAELEELHMHVTGVDDERATVAGELSRLVMEISNDLVNLGTLPHLGGGRPHSRASAIGASLQHQSLGQNSDRLPLPWSQAILPVIFFFVWNSCNIHTYIYMYIYIYIW